MISTARGAILIRPIIAKDSGVEQTHPAIRALIVDHGSRFRLEMRRLLELEDIEVVGEVANGWEALHLTEALNPDVILMDQNRPALSRIDATRRIKQAKPDGWVLFVASEEAWRQEAIRAGAEGCLVKGEGFDPLIRAILHPGLASGLHYQLETRPQRRRLVRSGTDPRRAGGIGSGHGRFPAAEGMVPGHRPAVRDFLDRLVPVRRRVTWGTQIN